jgi:hypothetical protein
MHETKVEVDLGSAAGAKALLKRSIVGGTGLDPKC